MNEGRPRAVGLQP